MEYSVVDATFEQILRNRSTRLKIFRLVGNAQIFVLDFPSLREQGRALNRLAAWAEGLDVPRDRVLSDTELADYIARVSGNADLFYVGHNYRLRLVARFFNLALDSVTLNASETRLRSALLQLGMIQLDSGVYQTDRPDTALIAVPQLQAANRAFGFDGGLRNAIFRHELSHGEFFTRADYRAFCERFWRERLTDRQKQAFVGFLQSLNYDIRDDEIVVNEMQAFLAHTPDARLFDADFVGLGRQELQELRAEFVARSPAILASMPARALYAAGTAPGMP